MTDIASGQPGVIQAKTDRLFRELMRVIPLSLLAVLDAIEAFLLDSGDERAVQPSSCCYQAVGTRNRISNLPGIVRWYRGTSVVLCGRRPAVDFRYALLATGDAWRCNMSRRAKIQTHAP